MAHVTITTKRESFVIETSVVFAVIDAGKGCTKQLCVIESASTIEVVAAIGSLLDLVDMLTERYPKFRLMAETARQARDIEKEEEKTDD